MINTSDISKDFILNKAIRDATNLLLKPYMPVVLTEANPVVEDAQENRYEAVNRLREKWLSQSQDFFLRMTTIAWDFLNVLNAYQPEIVHRIPDEDILDNDN